MNPFLILFSLITVISVLISGALLLIRRKSGGRWRRQDRWISGADNYLNWELPAGRGPLIADAWKRQPARKPRGPS